MAVKTKVCTKCNKRKRITAFTLCARNTDGANHNCRVCTRKYCARWFSNVQKDPTRRKRHWAARRGQHRAKKLEVFKAYGNKCACCGCRIEEFLSLDHINGGGKKHRAAVHNNLWRDIIRRGFPKKEFRLLCFNCNLSLGLFGYCPHHPRKKVSRGGRGIHRSP